MAIGTLDEAGGLEPASLPERGRAEQPEILLHEFIHVLDNQYSNYIGANGFQFDSMDFLSINATTVYSCLLGRGLRKDHHGFDFLPNEYFTNPRKHFDDLRVDYDRAKGAARPSSAMCSKADRTCGIRLLLRRGLHSNQHQMSSVAIAPVRCHRALIKLAKLKRKDLRFIVTV